VPRPGLETTTGLEVLTPAERLGLAGAALDARVRQAVNYIPDSTLVHVDKALADDARINEVGFIVSPYRKVKDGHVVDYVIVTNAGGNPKYTVGDVVEADELVGADGRSKKKGVEFEAHSFYLSAWENYGTIYRREAAEYQAGRFFVGGSFTVYGPTPNAPGMPTLRRGPINNWTEAVGSGAVIAIDPQTGESKWKFAMTDVTDSGILTTASDLLFTGGREGYFQALDARTGQLLWKTNLGGQIVSGPMTYQVDGAHLRSAGRGRTAASQRFSYQHGSRRRYRHLSWWT